MWEQVGHPRERLLPTYLKISIKIRPSNWMVHYGLESSSFGDAQSFKHNDKIVQELKGQVTFEEHSILFLCIVNPC